VLEFGIGPHCIDDCCFVSVSDSPVFHSEKIPSEIWPIRFITPASMNTCVKPASVHDLLRLTIGWPKADCRPLRDWQIRFGRRLLKEKEDELGLDSNAAAASSKALTRLMGGMSRD